MQQIKDEIEKFLKKHENFPDEQTAISHFPQTYGLLEDIYTALMNVNTIDFDIVQYMKDDNISRLIVEVLRLSGSPEPENFKYEVWPDGSFRIRAWRGDVDYKKLKHQVSIFKSPDQSPPYEEQYKTFVFISKTGQVFTNPWNLTDKKMIDAWIFTDDLINANKRNCLK